MPSHRPSPWVWIVAVMVGAPLLYVASFGPACWISSRVQPSGRFVSAAYRPLIRLLVDGPGWVGWALVNYVTLGTEESSTAFHGGETPEIQFYPVL